jgi:hypothetical protein
VFVLPAFETAPLADTEEAHALARTAAAQSKDGLLKMVEKGQLWQFALKIFKAVSHPKTTWAGDRDRVHGWAAGTGSSQLSALH